MNHGFCNSTLLAYLELAQRKPETYQTLLDELGVTKEWMTNKAAWHDADFLYRFFSLFQKLYLSDPAVLYQLKKEYSPEENFSPIAALTYKTQKTARIPIFQAALSMLISPRIILKRLPSIIGRINRYNQFEYIPGPHSILGNSGVFIQRYQSHELPELNKILSDTGYASLLGLFHAFGVEKIKVTRTRSVREGDELCEYHLKWKNAHNPLIRYAISFSLAMGGLAYLVWQNSVRPELAASGLACLGLFVVAAISIQSRRRLVQAYEMQEHLIDDLHLAYANMSRANLELVQMQQSYQEILSLASLGERSYGVIHDFASPVQAIAYAAKGLNSHKIEDGETSAQSEKYLTMVMNASSKLVQLQQLLRKSIIKNGESNLSEHSVSEIVHECIEASSHLSSKHEIDLVYEGPTSLVIESDRSQLVACLLNLIENAILAMSRSETAQPKLSLTWIRMNERIHLLVKDNGPGLPKRILQNPWTPFKRSEATHQGSAELPGTGFGLFKVRSTLVSLGCGIEVESSSTGTCFTISLPTPKAKEKSIAA